MKRTFMKGMLIICVAVMGLFLQTGLQAQAASTTVSTSYSGDNLEAQDYSWKYFEMASVIKSYLHYENGQLMRVQYDSAISGLLVEYYNTDYELKSSKLVAAELPIFGGFYATDDNYYVVTGQENPGESDAVEVLRIVKYDKNWNKLDSASVYGANTLRPTHAGSLRMTTSGKYLLIRTCHTMYKGNDGLNHQANMTFQVDMNTMEVTDQYTGIMNKAYGYVSHSFNQFIEVDGNQIVAVDHGDAYPRSIVLIKYKTDVSTGKFAPEYFTRCSVTDVLGLAGSIGDNKTSASVGGFEMSDDGYLIAGNSVIQDSSYATRKTENIFLSYVSKDTTEVVTTWLTNYAEGDGSTSTPHLIKLSGDSFMLMWSRDGVIYYTEVNGSGEQVSDIETMSGYLSDCVPVVVNDKLVWYVWVGNELIFYEIPAPVEYIGDVNTELQSFSYDESTHYLKGQIVVVEWRDTNGDGVKESTVPNCAPEMKFVSTDGTEEIDVFVTPTGTNTYYFDRLMSGLTPDKEYKFMVTSGNPKNVSEHKTVPVYTGTSGIGTQGKLGKINGQDIRFKTASDGTLLLYGKDSNAPYEGHVNSLLTNVQCVKSEKGNFVSGNIIITEWINGNSTVPETVPVMSFESYDGTEKNDVFMLCLDGTNTYYFDRNLSEDMDVNKDYIFRVSLTEPNNISARKTMVVTTNEMSQKEGVLWETATQIVKYKTVAADGDNQLRIYAVNK